MSSINSVAIEKLSSECLRLQLESDLYIDNAVSNKDSLSVPELEESFDKSIQTYQTTIDIMNNIFKADVDNKHTLEYKSYFENIINRKNQIIQLKSKTLSDKFTLSDSKVIMTLSDSILYRWQEDTTNNNNNVNNNDLDNVEKEIIGNGSIQLLKLYDRLHWLVITLHDSSNTVQFNLTPDTPILVSNKGHYIIQVHKDFYGILFPDNIPSVYLDVFEKQLSSISNFVYLKPISTTLVDNLPTIDTPIKEKTFTITSIETITKGVESSSATITNMILTTSAMISIGLRGGGMYLQSNLEKHTEPVQVSPMVSRSIGVVKDITPYAVSTSGFFINSVSDMVEGVGSTLINGVKMVIPEKDTNSSESNEALDAASKLGSTSFKAIGDIIGAFSAGIAQIYEEASGTTVDLVHHKYGKHVSHVTSQSISIGKDVVDTALTLGTTKQIALKVVKNGGTKIVEKNFIEQKKENQEKQLITKEE